MPSRSARPTSARSHLAPCGAAPAPATLVELVDALASVPPDRGLRFVSPRFDETFLPWRELRARVILQAASFRAQGVARGDRAMIALSTEPSLVAGFLALSWLGAVPVSVGGQLGGQSREAWLLRLAELREAHGFEHVVLESRLRDAAEEAGWPGAERLRELLDEETPGADGAELPPAPSSPDDVAFVQFSSGSTSEPKGVVLRHRNVLANVRAICSHDGRSAGSSVVMWVPLYHDMGLVGGLLSPLLHGNALTLVHPACFFLRPLSWLEQITRQRADVTACPNFALDTCVERIRDRHLERAGLDLSSLRFGWNGAEPIQPGSVLRFEERFAPHGLAPGVFQPAYGMAEASLAVTARPAGAPLAVREVGGSAVVSVGRPVANARVRIVGDDGTELAPGSIGEVQVRGDSVSDGYLGACAATADRFADGWHRSGDLGFLDGTGDLFVTGRKKDLIILHGRNFYGHDVAARLDDLPFLQRGQHHVFSIGADDGERVVVMTVLDREAARGGLQRLDDLLRADGAWLRSAAGATAAGWLEGASPADRDVLRDAVRRFLLEQIGLPVHDVMVVRRIPRTPSGKVRREECEALYLEARAATEEQMDEVS